MEPDSTTHIDLLLVEDSDRDGSLADRILGIVREAGVDPSRLWLEATERTLRRES